MPIEQIPTGTIVTLTQNVVYALPTIRALLFIDGTSPTIVQSNTSAFTASLALALGANGQGEVGGGFIKSTGGNVTAILKK